MAQERTAAQGQCNTFLNLYGRAKKQKDSAVCPRCHLELHPGEAGIADYLGAIKTPAGPAGIAVEVKDGDERFNFPEISPDQWRWLRRWEIDTNGTAWLWILLGTNRVDTNTDYARQTFFVPRHVLCTVRRTMIKVGNVNNLPLNSLAAHTRVLTRENNLCAVNLLWDWRCEWQGKNLWLPHERHYFWRLYNVRPSDASTPRRSKGNRIRTAYSASRTR